MYGYMGIRHKQDFRNGLATTKGIGLADAVSLP